MRKIILPALMALVVLATSCVSQHNVNRAYAPMKPDQVRLNVTMADYEYLGDVTMEVTYKKYGLVKKILTINGKNYDPRFYTTTQLDFTKRVPMSKIMRKACYKVLEQYPNADYIVPANSYQVYEHMMGGRNIKETLTVKVFAIRTESNDKSKEQIEQLTATNQQLTQTAQTLRAENQQIKAQLQTAQEELDIQKRINAASVENNAKKQQRTHR